MVLNPGIFFYQKYLNSFITNSTNLDYQEIKLEAKDITALHFM